MVSLSVSKLIGGAIAASLYVWIGFIKTVVYGHALRPWWVILAGLVTVGIIVFSAHHFGYISSAYDEYVPSFSIVIFIAVSIDVVGNAIMENPEYATIGELAITGIMFTLITGGILYYERQIIDAMEQRIDLENSH